MNGQHPQGHSVLSFVDKDTYPARRFTAADGIRIIPGGSSIRAGAFVAKGVVCMPPMYINAGAYVERRHHGRLARPGRLLRADRQARPPLRRRADRRLSSSPSNASPVIIEDDVLVGGNTGVYEGTIVRARAVLAAGTILTRGTPVYDLPNDTILKATAETPLIHPAGAVVVPGSRAITTSAGKALGLSVYTPIIVKYRDEKNRSLHRTRRHPAIAELNPTSVRISNHEASPLRPPALTCWPLALVALVLYPIVWLLLLPFRILGIAVDGVLKLIAALFLLPSRLLRAI